MKPTRSRSGVAAPDALLLEAMREVDAMYPHTPPIAPPAVLMPSANTMREFLPPWCWLDVPTQMVHNHRDYSIKPLEWYKLRRRRAR